MKNNNLRDYYPIIRTKKEILTIIKGNRRLRGKYIAFPKHIRREILDFCSGAKGMKVLYDSFFKEVLNPEYHPERLNDLLSEILEFNYGNIKSVYVIVFFETSPKEFADFPDTYIHNFKQTSDSGLELELLQKYIFIPLDIFSKNTHNVDNKFNTWLTFLSSDKVKDIINLTQRYPEFKAMYETIYNMCLNVVGVMNMFSKELYELDKATELYMIDRMQRELDEQRNALAEQRVTLNEQRNALAMQRVALNEQRDALAEKDNAIAEKNNTIAERDNLIKELQQQLQQSKTI